MIEIKSVEHFEKISFENNEKILVVKFTADFCGPCKKIQPLYEKLSKDYSDKFICVKVDVQKCSELSDKYDIKSIPTFKFLKNGVEVRKEITGANEELLKKVFKEI
jgi:thioredoxin 1